MEVRSVFHCALGKLKKVSSLAPPSGGSRPGARPAHAWGLALQVPHLVHAAPLHRRPGPALAHGAPQASGAVDDAEQRGSSGPVRRGRPGLPSTPRTIRPHTAPGRSAPSARRRGRRRRPRRGAHHLAPAADANARASSRRRRLEVARAAAASFRLISLHNFLTRPHLR